MGLTKNILFGSIAAVVSTTAVVGTVVGLSSNKNSSNTTSMNNAPIKNDIEQDVSNKQTDTADKDVVELIEQEEIDLVDLANSITKQHILINNATSHSSLYAFNIKRNDLALSKEITIPKGIDLLIKLDEKTNTPTYLNEGKLGVEISLNKEASLIRRRFEIDGFKKASVSEFTNLLSENNLVLEINTSLTSGIDKNSDYVSLETLNSENLTISSPDNIQRTDQTQKGNGLTYWLYKDQSKKDHLTNIRLEGEVMLERISSNDKNAIFHLVAKDVNSHIKLIKDVGEDKKEIVLDEIKTTNLLASDINIIPISSLEPKQQDKFLNELNKINEKDKQYLTDKKDESLERYLSVDLATSPETNKVDNRVFIKPYITQLENKESKFDYSIVVSFGSNDFQTSFDTSIEDELKQLQNAGFKFGIYTKKLTETSSNINATNITNKKELLAKYFTKNNYIKPVDNQTQTQTPNTIKFNLTKLDDLSSTNNFAIDIKDKLNTNQATNLITFASYSYKGIEENKALFTPVINLIHIQNKNNNS